MAVVPTPNLPDVSQGRANAKISGAALAAPGKALAGAVQEGLGQFARLSLQAEEKKRSVEDQLYQKELNIKSYEVTTRKKAFVQTLAQQFENANPADMKEIFEGLDEQYRADHDEITAGLKPEDKDFMDERLEIDLRAMEGNAKLLRTQKIIDNETIIAEDTLKTNMGDDDPESVSAVEKSKAILVDNLGEAQAAVRIRKLEASAFYERTLLKLDQADTVDEVMTISENVETNAPNTESGNQIALRNAVKGQLKAINTELTMVDRGLVRQASNGEAFNQEIVDELIATGKTTQERVDELASLSLAVNSQRLDKQTSADFIRFDYPAIHADFKERFEDTDGSPEEIEAVLKEGNAAIDKATTSPLARSVAKLRLLGQYRTTYGQDEDAVGGPNVLQQAVNWWFVTDWGVSDHAGDRIKEIQDEQTRTNAINTFKFGVDEVGRFMRDTGQDIDLSDVLTQLETNVAAAFKLRGGKPLDAKQLKTLVDSALDQTSQVVLDGALQGSAKGPAPTSELEKVRAELEQLNKELGL